MSPTARALLAELLGDPDGLAELAAALAEHLPQAPAEEDRWMTTRDAAGYLGLSVNALHRLTAERCVPFEQDGPGAKCWFKRADLDAWRRSDGAAAAPAPLLRSVNPAP